MSNYLKAEVISTPCWKEILKTSLNQPKLVLKEL